jgi:hypothetical protein
VLPPSFCQDLFILKSAQAVTLAGSIGFIERSTRYQDTKSRAGSSECEVNMGPRGLL